ncbi:hypothetical protein [Agromyces allii]|uniref:DUF3558 domain-containing protein n=1 Tax=Agromyces allii TaxID=393607 RepID=A0ABN2QMS3_9MICO|nr:hypothetical protein [Agromyces allii]
MMRSNRVRTAALLAIVAVLALAGCAPMPTAEAARGEARDDMQAFVDLLPADSVDHVEDPIPSGFLSCGSDAAQYSGQWLVYLTDPAAVEGAVGDLRRDAADAGFAEDGFPDNRDDWFSVRREGDRKAPMIAITSGDDRDEVPFIQILSFARCSEPPDHSK